MWLLDAPDAAPPKRPLNWVGFFAHHAIFQSYGSARI
jgi:hypothetical protein